MELAAPSANCLILAALVDGAHGAPGGFEPVAASMLGARGGKAQTAT